MGDSAHRKLTEDQVLEIYDRLLAGEAGAALGREFGVAKQTISRIRTGETYSDVTGIERELMEPCS